MKRICAVACSLVMLCSSIGAAELRYSADFDNGDIEIGGVIGGTEYNRLVSIEINDGDGAALFVQTIPATPNGEFEVLLKLPETMESGQYTMILRPYNLNEKIEEDLGFVDADDALSVKNEINAAESAEEIEAVLAETPAILNIAEKYYTTLTDEQWTDIGEQVFSERPDGGFESANDIGTVISDDIALWAVENATTAKEIETAINDFKDIFAINEENEAIKLYDIYKDFGSNEIASVNTILADENPTTLEEFYSELNKAVFVVDISNAEEPIEIIETIDNYANDVGLDLTYYNKTDGEAVGIYLSGKTFKSITELEAEIKKAYEDESGKNNGTNNGSGGGGGAGGGGGSSSGGSGSSGSKNENNNEGNKTEENIPQDKPVFSDIENVEWAKDAIIALAEKNIVAGDGSGNFRPNDNITREEFVKILIAAFEIPFGDAEVSFNDVGTSHWAYPYIAAAYEAGIVKGISEAEFGTGNLITRQDMAVMAANTALYCGIELDGTPLSFTDAEKIAGYAAEAVGKMSGAGVINGFVDGSFKPLENASRAQAAKIIYALIAK